MKSRYVARRIGIGVAIATVLACGGNNTGIVEPGQLASVVVWIQGSLTTGGAIYGKVLDGDLATSQMGEIYPGSTDSRKTPFISNMVATSGNAWEIALFWVEDVAGGSVIHQNRLTDQGDQGDEIVVSDGAFASSPVSSTPDRKWWASNAGGTADIYYQPGSGAKKQLTTGEGAVPTDIHPTGTNTADLLFTRNIGGTGDFEVFAMNAYDGTNRRNLTNNPARDINPRYSPDGTKIVFASNRARGRFNIFMMNADGTGVEALTDLSADHATPCFSADGKYVVYAARRDGDYDIFALNLATRTEVALTNDGPSGINDYAPHCGRFKAPD